MKSKSGKIVLCVIAAIAIGLATVLLARPMLSLVSEPETFRAFVKERGAVSALIFIGMVILQIVFAFIPGEPFEIAAGFAFGTLMGTILCIIATTIGSMLVFFLVRKFGIRLVLVFFPEEKLRSLGFLKSSPKRSFLFFLIYMIPGTPKDLLSYFAGLTDISVRKWFLICLVGRFPSLITSTVGGDAIGTKDYTFAIIVFAATIIISGIGILIYRAISRRYSSQNADNPSNDSNPRPM